jgi:dihydroorotase
MKILIKNATIVNPNKVFKASILIEKDKIVSLAQRIRVKADKEIDAEGKHVFPGFIDMHAHFRTPGREDEEDIFTGACAAVRGGYTTVCCMPNTNPAIDNEARVRWLIEEAQKDDLIDLFPAGAITKERAGKELTEFAALRRAGALLVTDDGSAVRDPLILRRALEYSKMVKILIAEHCEEHVLTQNGSLREGLISSKYGIAAIPAIAESLVVARDIELAKYLGARIHLMHISTARSLEIIKRAKKDGVKVSCETCPHYFSLTVDDVEAAEFSGNFKVNPPLGDKKDIEAVKKALRDGVIDCISTDHAPHSPAEKELPFEDAPFGFVGLETAFAVSYTNLVKSKIMDLKNLAQKMAYNPARVLGLENRGKIAKNFKADLVIVDLNRQFKVTEKTFASKSKNSPFLGKELFGAVNTTIHNGRIVYSADADE